MIGRLSPSPGLGSPTDEHAKRMCLWAAFLLLLAPWAHANPWSHATLYRDAWGVPHVYAANPLALGYAIGWAQAEDRSTTLLRGYRVARGRAAEVWGEEYAESDAFAIKMGHTELAMQAWPGLDPITQTLCEGFAAGANAWMQANAGALPPWAVPVEPYDPIIFLHYYQLTFAPLDLPNMWRPNPGTPTGSAWAVSGNRSRDGAALLVANPHASYDSAFQWYELHAIAGDYNVLGGTLVGLPLPLMGHNARIAWGLAPNRPDIADVYEDSPPTSTRSPANVIFDPSQGLAPPTEMLWQQWVMMHARPYYVNTPGGMETRSVVSLQSNFGPLLGETPNGNLWTYRVGGYGDFGGLRQLWEMGRAQGLGDFRAALSLHQLAAFHIVFADADGNIFYRYNAKVGMKQDIGGGQVANLVETLTGEPAPSSWRRPQSGNDGRFHWGPIIPPEEMPTIVNPSSGWVQASGNPPWEATTGLSWGPMDLPRWLVRDTDSHRAQRVRQLLRTWDISFQDAQAMVFDVVVPGAIAALPHLKTAAEAHPEFVMTLHPDLVELLNILDAWNFVAEPDSPGMTAFHAWWHALGLMAGTSDSLFLSRLAGIRTEERQKDLLRAASDAAQSLRNQFGEVDIPWGEVHRLRRGARTEPMAGGLAGEPVLMASPPALHGERSIRYGFGYGMVVELGDPIRSVSLLPYGASDDPDSLHFDDQMDLLLQRRFKRSPHDLDSVQREANSAFGSALFLRAPGLDGQVVVRTDYPVRARMVSFVEPPLPIPDGLAPFSLYAMPLIDAIGVSAHATIEIRVPEELCRDEHLDALAVYGFDDSAGWVRLPYQTFDPVSRAFLAEDSTARLVAVLGPARLRLRSPVPESVPRPEGYEAPEVPDGLRPLILAEARDSRNEPTIGELGVLEPLPETGAAGPPSRPAPRTQRTAAATPQSAAPSDADPLGLLQGLLAPQEPSPVFETASGRIEFHTPPPAIRRPATPRGVASEEPVVAAPPPGESVLRTDTGGFIAIGPQAVPTEPPAIPSEPVIDLEEDVLSPAEEQPVEPSPSEESGESDEAPAPIEVAAAPQEATTPATTPAVPPQAPAPARSPGPEPQATGGELRAAAVGAIARGAEMVVRAPGDTAFFQLTAPESIAARAAVLEGPPVPFPSGLVNFSEVVAIEFDPPDAAVAVTLTVMLPRGACRAEDIPKLVLHGYTADAGWQPVPGQQVSVPARSFSSAGSRALAYAVLGDRSLRPSGVGP